MKIHYSFLTRANESNTQEEWSHTFCGIKEADRLELE